MFRDFSEKRYPFLAILRQKHTKFSKFLGKFWKSDPYYLGIFSWKMGPMFRDFLQKTDPKLRHLPICLNMWVPPWKRRPCELTFAWNGTLVNYRLLKWDPCELQKRYERGSSGLHIPIPPFKVSDPHPPPPVQNPGLNLLGGYIILLIDQLIIIPTRK